MRSNRFIVLRQATAKESAGRIAHTVIRSSRLSVKDCISAVDMLLSANPPQWVLSQDLKSDMEYLRK